MQTIITTLPEREQFIVTLHYQEEPTNMKIFRTDLETNKKDDVSEDPRYITCMVATEKFFEKYPNKDGFLYENSEIDVGFGCLPMIRYLIKTGTNKYKMIGSYSIDENDNYEFLIEVDH